MRKTIKILCILTIVPLIIALGGVCIADTWSPIHKLYRDYGASNSKRDILINEIKVFNHLINKATTATTLAIENDDKEACEKLYKLIKLLGKTEKELVERVTFFVKDRTGI